MGQRTALASFLRLSSYNSRSMLRSQKFLLAGTSEWLFISQNLRDERSRIMVFNSVKLEMLRNGRCNYGKRV